MTADPASELAVLDLARTVRDALRAAIPEGGELVLKLTKPQLAQVVHGLAAIGIILDSLDAEIAGLLPD